MNLQAFDSKTLQNFKQLVQMFAVAGVVDFEQVNSMLTAEIEKTIVSRRKMKFAAKRAVKKSPVAQKCQSCFAEYTACENINRCPASMVKGKEKYKSWRYCSRCDREEYSMELC